MCPNTGTAHINNNMNIGKYALQWQATVHRCPKQSVENVIIIILYFAI